MAVPPLGLRRHLVDLQVHSLQTLDQLALRALRVLEPLQELREPQVGLELVEQLELRALQVLDVLLVLQEILETMDYLEMRELQVLYRPHHRVLPLIKTYYIELITAIQWVAEPLLMVKYKLHGAGNNET